ncbi:MAG: AI-2E family transporter [Variibacter sp.]|nr:AI-2E family transporter [Variibacter sp.]
MNQQRKLADLAGKRRPDAAPRNGGPVRATGPDSTQADAEPFQLSLELLSQAALVLIGFVVLIVALSLGRSVVMPVLAALIIGITVRPAQTFAARYGVPPALTALVLVAVLFGAIYAAVNLVIGPLAAWLPHAKELAPSLKEKFSWLDGPLAVWREVKASMGGSQDAAQSFGIETSLPALLQGAVQILTPAISEFLVFFGTLLFFLVGSDTLRRRLITAFSTRGARLRVMRIWNEVETDLTAYVSTVTVINLALGAVTAGMCFLLGLPNPLTLGVLAFALNYVPYIGPAIVVMILFGVGLLSLPSLGAAVLAPALFVAMTTVEGHFITPNVIGRRLTLSPFLVFLALAFWTWLWGPLGAFLATPLLIVSLAVMSNLFPGDETELPK